VAENPHQSETTRRAWSFLSLERTARLGLDETAYPDELGVRYAYDTYVAHHAEVQTGDLAVIRDDRVVLGAGWIDKIQVGEGHKTRRRCPACRSTAYKFRYTVTPHFRCAACFAEFDQPEQNDVTVKHFNADYSRTWRPADSLFGVAELSPIYASRAAQHSIRRLDFSLLKPMLLAHLSVSELWLSDRLDSDVGVRGGYRTSLGKTRLGQQRFREEMLGRFGRNCAFTGPQPAETLEAAHLYFFSITPHHDLRGGLLLRRDLHALFDRGLVTIDPTDWCIDVAPSLDRYPLLRALRGKPLGVPIALRPRRSYIEAHVVQSRSSWVLSSAIECGASPGRVEADPAPPETAALPTSY
jgi:hypothetical protein